MWNYKIAKATFRTSQCQDSDEVLKCYEWRNQGIKDALENPNTRKSTSRRILTDILSKNSELKLNLRASLCKILISSFAHKMDFAHNFSVDFV